MPNQWRPGTVQFACEDALFGTVDFHCVRQWVEEHVFHGWLVNGDLESDEVIGIPF